MSLEINNFIVEYDEDLEYIPELIANLESKTRELMNFFELKSLSSKRKIIVYKDLEEYKKHIEEYFEYQDYMCADTMDGNINVLSLEAAHQTEKYKNITVDYLKSVITHEFVHICQQESEVEHIDNDIVWFWEALATNLGNPDGYKSISIEETNEEINEFNSPNSYPIAFTIGNFMLENYSHNEMLQYVKYPTELLKDSEKILDSAREWSNKKKSK